MSNEQSQAQNQPPNPPSQKEIAEKLKAQWVIELTQAGQDALTVAKNIAGGSNAILVTAFRELFRHTLQLNLMQIQYQANVQLQQQAISAQAERPRVFVPKVH